MMNDKNSGQSNWQKIVLINISGADQFGVTAMFSTLLAQFNATILDIGQAVIHQRLSLGILAEISETDDSANKLKEMEAALQTEAAQMGMTLCVETVSHEHYTDWVAQQGKPRHIITLLAHSISANQISRITALLSQQKLNIDNITRLSGRVPLNEINHRTQACVEFSVRGMDEASGEDGLLQEMSIRKSLMRLAAELDVDIAFQEDNVFRRNRRVVVFDMDSTLIQMEVIDELAKRAGVGDQVTAITDRAMSGELDFQASFKQRVALLAGMPETVLSEVAEDLVLSEGAERLISGLKKLGYKTVILSGGFTYFGRLLQEKLGIDYVYANELDISEGVVTGCVTGTVVDGARKAELLRQIAEAENISLEQVIAVGDGANDLPMLSIAGLGIAFRAKPIVKASAKQSLSAHGLDGILYMLGLTEKELI